MPVNNKLGYKHYLYHSLISNHVVVMVVVVEVKMLRGSMEDPHVIYIISVPLYLLAGS